MSELTTAEVIRRFNEAFVNHDAAPLADLVAERCVMESVQPAPDGTRYEGREACLKFWQALAADPNVHFEPEGVVVTGDRATIRWRARFGDTARPVFGEGLASSVRGVNLMQVRDGQIVEALGYTKSP
jgi:ketosteroid isomerase-like protein